MYARPPVALSCNPSTRYSHYTSANNGPPANLNTSVQTINKQQSHHVHQHSSVYNNAVHSVNSLQQNFSTNKNQPFVKSNDDVANTASL